MTNEELMKIMTAIGLHEGGMDNWVPDNVYLRLANTILADFKERLACTIEDMPFGDTAASFAQFVREFK